MSTSGAQLLPEAAVTELRKDLLHLATVLTPNVPEAIALLSDAGIEATDPKSVDDLIRLTQAVQSLGPKYVLVKGGHVPLRKNGTRATTEAEKEIVVNILYGEGETLRVETHYQQSRNTHGTGCSLACKFRADIIATRY